MKNTLKTISLFALVFALLPFSNVISASLSESLSGRILLQVESKGEAWYVDPETTQRYYLGRPNDAFSLMRSLGLGISNSDLAQIAVSGSTSTGNNQLAQRLSGKILLQVESKGEAWYVNPIDLRRYYLGRPSDAFAVMRSQGLGITDANLQQISISAYSSTPIEFIPEQAVVEQPVTNIPVFPEPIYVEPVRPQVSHSVIVNGDETCHQQTQQAMDRLYYDAYDYYEFFTYYIKIIDCTQDKSGVYVWETPVRFEAGWQTRSAGVDWFASVLVHEACHAWQYQRYPGDTVPYEEYYGQGPEMECTEVQKQAAIAFGAADYLINSIEESTNFAYWDVEYDERYW